jgi:hypothetical protein
MKNTKSLCLLVISILFLATGCVSYPKSLEKNFQLAGKNNSELKKVIRHYSTHRADSLKRKAVIFLIENMDAHVSYVSKSWDDFQGELDTFYKKEDRPSELNRGFNTLYDKYANGLQDISYVSDLQTVSAQFLIANVDMAFQTWKSPYCNYLNFADFCEYILPYRVGTEPLIDWRAEFNKQFIPDLYARLKERKDSISARNICNALKTYPYGTITFFPAEVPDYNVHTLSIMRLGSCRYYSIQAALAARCMGIPVALDNTPQWATRSFGHEWNAFITPNNKPLAFGIGDKVELGKHIENVADRIAPKVYRETFAKQPSSLAMIHDIEEIPPAFQSICFKDVTKEYYQTTDVLVKPLIAAPENNKFAYLSVFNNQDWVPVAWTKIEKNNFLFKSLNKGICCLPSYYYQGRVIPAAYPVLLRKDGTITTLKPDLKKRETITLKRKYQDRMHEWLGYAMLGGKFQAANDSSFKDAVDIYKISVKPEQYYQLADIAPTSAYKYFRYLSPKGSYGEVAEIEVYEPGFKQKLSGKAIGNNNPAPDRQRSNAFDGDALTNFRTKEADSTWVGLVFDTPKSIARIVYLPRNDGNCIADNQQYELFYWDHKWVSLGKQTGSYETYRLTYNNVPTNALLLLRNLTKGREERIFTYEKGEQVWW